MQKTGSIITYAIDNYSTDFNANKTLLLDLINRTAKSINVSFLFHFSQILLLVCYSAGWINTGTKQRYVVIGAINLKNI